MSFELINVGSGRLATDGECIRDAFVKINSNFENLFVLVGSEQLDITVDINNTNTTTETLTINDSNSDAIGSLSVSNDSSQSLDLLASYNLNLNNAALIDGSQNISFPSGTSIDYTNANLNLDLNKINQFNVNFETIENGQFLRYNSSTGKFEVFTINLDHYTDADVDTHLNTSTATTNQVLSWTGTDYDWVDPSAGGGGLANVVEDTTPELGGNLDALGNNIVNVDTLSGETDTNMFVQSTGTGTLFLSGTVNMYDRYTFPNATPTVRQFLVSDDDFANLAWSGAHGAEYTPTTSSDWSTPAPVSIGAAIDRLATLVKTLNGGTGA